MARKYKAYVVFEAHNGYRLGVYLSCQWPEAKRATDGLTESPQGFKTVAEAERVWAGGIPSNPKRFYVLQDGTEIFYVYYHAKRAAKEIEGGSASLVHRFDNRTDAQAFVRINEEAEEARHTFGRDDSEDEDPPPSIEEGDEEETVDNEVPEDEAAGVDELLFAPLGLIGPASNGLTIAFDVETTGLNPDPPDNDQIVQLSMVRYLNGERNGATEAYWFRPTVAQMSEEAFQVHGISMERLQQHPTFQEQAHVIRNSFQGVDCVMGYNVKFDLKFLQAELVRADLDPLPVRDYNIVDPYGMQTHYESRTLSATYRRLMGRDMADAHNASADVKATLQVYNALVNRYGLEDASPEDLNQASRGRRIDLDGKFVWNPQGQVVFNFGAHFQSVVCDVEHESYLNWMLRTDFSSETKMIAELAKEDLASPDDFHAEVRRRFGMRQAN